MAGYYVDIKKRTKENDHFRQILFSASLSQLVVMSLQPGEEIGSEIHSETDQFIRVEEGEGKVILECVEYKLMEGWIIVIPAGKEHKVINTSSNMALKLYTIYTPPKYPHGSFQKTEADAGYEEEQQAGVH